ncbi:unnamed protein product [marine sediment metagenome]|uniref:Uncharacterized protein n=1 Tax=marine sediment metagenome TaxID=412755 RepID=X0URL0_9ZZZZ
MIQKHVAFAPENKWGLAPFIGPIYSQDFSLLSFGEKACPLSLPHGFFTI